MEFSRSESPIGNEAEERNKLEVKLEKLNIELRNLISGKDKEGNDLTTKEEKARAKAKQEKKEIKREIVELKNKINLLSVIPGDISKKESPSVPVKEKSKEPEKYAEIGAEFFGGGQEDFNLAAKTIRDRAQEVVADINSEGKAGIDNIVKAGATAEELGNAKKKEEKIKIEANKADKQLEAELAGLSVPEIVAVENLNKQQLIEKFNEVSRYISEAKIDLASLNNQDYSDEQVKMGEYRIELAEKIKEIDTLERINNFDFNGAKDKNDLLDRIRMFYPLLSDDNPNNETIGDLILFLEKGDKSDLLKAKTNIGDGTDENVKGKVWELITKCEDIMKVEPKKENKAEVSEKSKEGDKGFENINFDNIKDKNDLLSRMRLFYKTLSDKHLSNETVGDLMLFVSEGSPSHMENAKNNIEKCADENAKNKLQELITKCEEIMHETEKEKMEKQAFLSELKDRMKELAEGDLHSLRRAIEDNLDEQIIGDRYGEEQFRSLIKREVDFKKVKILTIKEVKEVIETVYKEKTSEEKEKWDELGRVYEGMVDGKNEYLADPGNNDEEKQRVFESMQILDDTDDFLFKQYGIDRTQANEKMALKLKKGVFGSVIEKYKRGKEQSGTEAPEILSDVFLAIMQKDRLEKEIANVRNYLEFLKAESLKGKDMSEDFGKYGLYLQKLEDRAKTIDNPDIKASETSQGKMPEKGEMEIMNNEDIKKITDPEMLQGEINKIISYLNESRNIPEEEHSSLSEYIDRLEMRKNQLKMKQETEEYKRVNKAIEYLNKTVKIIEIERPSEKEEIESVKNSKSIKELDDSIKKINSKGLGGKNDFTVENIKNLLGELFSQVVDVKNDKFKENINCDELKNEVIGKIAEKIAKPYVEAFFAGIENIKKALLTEQEKGYKVGDKIYVKEEDGQVRGGWVVKAIKGNNIEVENKASGKNLKTTYGELAAWNSDKLIKDIEDRKKEEKDLQDKIKLMEFQAEQNREDVSKNEEYRKLVKRLEELQGRKAEKKEEPQTYGELIENLKKMEQFLEKRRLEFSKIESDEETQKIADKVSRGEKLSEEENARYKSRFMAKDEVTISQIGKSVVENTDLYLKTPASLTYKERMEIFRMRIELSKSHILLHEELRTSIRSCNEKIEQMNPKKKEIASAIVDGILDGAKKIPIIRNLVYSKIETRTEEEKKKEEGIKEGATVSVKEKNEISEGWKIVKVDGDNVKLEKEGRVVKEFKEKDLMQWNKVSEKGKFKKGDKIKVLKDGRIETEWVVESVADDKIISAKEKFKTEKIVKKKDIIIQEKAAEKEGFKQLAKDLNELKNSELNMNNIKDMASFDNTSKALKTKFEQMAQKASYFEGLDDKLKKDFENIFNIDLGWYTGNIKEKHAKGLKKDREQDKAAFDQIAEKHKNYVKNLPDDFKDFKENMAKLIEFASYAYHETKYSDEAGEEKPENKEVSEADRQEIKQLFNSNEIKRVNEAKNWDELIKTIENRKIEASSKLDNPTMAKLHEMLGILLDNFDLNERKRKITTFPASELDSFNLKNPEFASNEQVKKFVGSVYYMMSALLAKEMGERKDQDKKPSEQEGGAGDARKKEWSKKNLIRHKGEGARIDLISGRFPYEVLDSEIETELKNLKEVAVSIVGDYSLYVVKPLEKTIALKDIGGDMLKARKLDVYDSKIMDSLNDGNKDLAIKFIREATIGIKSLVEELMLEARSSLRKNEYIRVDESEYNEHSEEIKCAFVDPFTKEGEYYVKKKESEDKKTPDKKPPESEGKAESGEKEEKQKPESKEAKEINELLEKIETRINAMSQFVSVGIFDNAIKSVKLQIEEKNYEAAKKINELIWEIIDPSESEKNDSINQRLRKILEIERSEGVFYKKKEIDFIPKLKPEDVLKEYKSLKKKMESAGKGIDIVIPMKFYEKLPKLIENKEWETANSIIAIAKDMLKDKRLRKLGEIGF